MFPSSFGMTFCVSLEAKQLVITGRWGHYSRQRSETLTTPTGDKKLVWKRSPRQGVSKPIPLQMGRVTWTPDAEFPQVQVQGIIRKRDHFWSVTLFLVNGQVEPKKLRDTAWLFQPELRAFGKNAREPASPQRAARTRGKVPGTVPLVLAARCGLASTALSFRTLLAWNHPMERQTFPAISSAVTPGRLTR